MARSAVVVTSLLILLAALWHKQSCDSLVGPPYSFENVQTHYKAAVVEYKPIGSPWNETGPSIISRNVQEYIVHIETAAQQSCDIIVFPEYGLTTLGIPRDRVASKQFLLEVPEVGQNPCDDQLGSQAIQDLSCASKSKEIYVVVNLGEIRRCNLNIPEIQCPRDGVFHYNLNVAFDKWGTVIAKYPKTHLYFEDQFDKPQSTELTTFETSFGVTFGIFTCFDIIFDDPAVHLVNNGIKNFVFPTAWVDELPFLTGIQAQEAWAYASDANLLASGYHQPLGGQLGSGIYSGKSGAKAYTFDPDSGTRIVTGEVPIVPTNMTNLNVHTSGGIPTATYHNFLREDLQNYTTKILNLSLSTDELCTENNFCCRVQYAVGTTITYPDSMENYRLVAFNGTRYVAAKTATYEWQVCAVVRCLNQTLESCSENNKNSTSFHLPTFQQLELSTAFDLAPSSKFLPMLDGLDVTLTYLIPPSAFSVTLNVTTGVMLVRAETGVLSNVNVKTVALINKLFDG